LAAGLSRQVETLCQLIDSLFEAGVGEEYLERLVKASEDSASQSKILKDALVGELKQILHEITEQQIQASLVSQQNLGQQLVQSIETGIRQPLAQIADGFKTQREDTGKDISYALEDVPAEAAYEVAGQLVRAGIGGIINFSPVVLPREWEGVFIHNIDVINDIRFMVSHITLQRGDTA